LIGPEEHLVRKIVLLLTVVGLLWPILFTGPAEAASSRTFVSAAGDDSNPCTQSFPCLTFAGALVQTTAGGEINCQDSGDYGPMTISFAVTISCEGATAAVSVGSGGTGIQISASAADDITLRGLDLNGNGTGNSGISVSNARTVHIESCAIRGFRFSGTSAGIVTSTSTNTIFMYVTDSVLSSNSNGVTLFSSGGFKVASLKNAIITGSSSDGVLAANPAVYVNITESVLSGNGGSAVRVAAPASFANVDRTTMANNGVALNAAASGATIRAVGNNIFDNTTAFSFAGGATIATDGQNRTGGNLSGQDGNASVTLK
jgi:hypothetical protein